jgi:hypothetical protein
VENLRAVIIEHTKKCLKLKLKEQDDVRWKLTECLKKTSKKYIQEAHCEDDSGWFGAREYVSAKDYLLWKSQVYGYTKKCKRIKHEIKTTQKILNFLTNKGLQ